MTNHWCDIQNSDCIIIVGSNAAENHPVSFKWVTKAMEKNGATLINIDPRFTRSSAKADIYAKMRSGTDIAFFGGMIKEYLLGNGWFGRSVFEACAFVKSHPEARLPDLQLHTLPWGYPDPNQDGVARTHAHGRTADRDAYVRPNAAQDGLRSPLVLRREGHQAPQDALFLGALTSTASAGGPLTARGPPFPWS